MEIEFKVNVHPDELKHTLHANLASAAAWTCLAVLIGIYFKDLWPLIAMAGLALIWTSFSSYRQLHRQQNTPDLLRLEDQSLLYLVNGKKTIRIPFRSIAQVGYREGVVLRLHRGGRVELLDPTFRLCALKKGSVNLSFKWFSPSVKTCLDDIVHANQPQKPRPL